jgi:hypothetical protein
MFRKRTIKFSPATPTALIALFVALGGVSYAAGTIGTSELQNGAVTKKKLHRNSVAAGKIASGAVNGDKLASGSVSTTKLVDEAVTGAKVNEATLGVVPDAASLAGKQPQAFESKGFGGSGSPTNVGLPTSATTEVKTLALPAGTYLVIGRGGLNNNGAEVGAGQSCTVAAGTVSQTVGFGALGANSKAGDREEFETFVIATLDSPGNATLSCQTNASWETGNITNATLAAVSLQP